MVQTKTVKTILFEKNSNDVDYDRNRADDGGSLMSGADSRTTAKFEHNLFESQTDTNEFGMTSPTNETENNDHDHDNDNDNENDNGSSDDEEK